MNQYHYLIPRQALLFEGWTEFSGNDERGRRFRQITPFNATGTMSDIGPQIPAHLLKEYNADRDDDAGAREEEEEDGEGGAAIGPVLPSSLKRRRDSDENEEEPDIGPSIGPVLPSSSSKATQQKEDPDSDSDEDDDYMPALPPELIAQRESGPEPPKKRVAGPAMPPPSSSHQQHYRRSYSDDEDDDLVGPRPDLAAVEFDTEEYEALVRREEIEARARKAREGDKEEKVERGEWMLVPPEAKKLGSEWSFVVVNQSRCFVWK